MRIHPGLFSAVGHLPRGSVAIGNFDGVHVGHRALFAAARDSASRSGGKICALTFDPHPAAVLAPQFAPPAIGSALRKLELLAEAGVDDAVVQRFDRDFARTSAAEFVSMLAATGVSTVVVGQDFTYGKDRGGNAQSLRAALGDAGVDLQLVPPVTVEGLVVSSTKVREFVLEGRLEAARALLGRPLDLDGQVVRGAGRGRTLGWPTANVQYAEGQLLPAIGVYAVRVRVLEAEARGAKSEAADGGGAPALTATEFTPPRFGPSIKGAANLGLNPTFRDAAPTGQRPPLLLEVHLIDFAGDLYGRTLRVEFVQRLRDERRFNGIEALKAQILSDVGEAKRALAPAPAPGPRALRVGVVKTGQGQGQGKRGAAAQVWCARPIRRRGEPGGGLP